MSRDVLDEEASWAILELRLEAPLAAEKNAAEFHCAAACRFAAAASPFRRVEAFQNSSELAPKLSAMLARLSPFRRLNLKLREVLTARLHFR